jgi:photosystem II stability/assembly factor-like uncharacterized protein
MPRSLIALLGILFFSACSKHSTPTLTPPRTDSVPATTPPTSQIPPDTARWKTINTHINTDFLDIWFTDSLHGVMTGADSMLYRSTDGGQTWQPAISSRSDLQCFYFLNAQQGYAAGINNIAYTLDGGQTWTVKKIKGLMVDTLPQNIFPWPNLLFVSGSTGYITTGKGLYMTTDTGNTWTIVNTHPVEAACFTNANTGFAYYPYDSITKTTDGGKSWQPVVVLPIPGSPMTINNRALHLLRFTDDLHGWFSDGFNIAGTKDGGQSWQLLHTFQFQGYTDIKMLSNKLGYICGHTIMKTTDGGNSWQTDVDLGSNRAISIFMLDSTHGWACGGNGLVFKYGR